MLSESRVRRYDAQAMTAVSQPRVAQRSPVPTPQIPVEVSIVVPVYFNARSLQELQARLAAAMAAAEVATWDVTFVDDGSGDDSLSVLLSLRERFAGIRVLRLSRNFGSMAAIQAGLEHARGRCVAVISADLQDPPEMLATMVRQWRAGAEVVLATRESREDPWSSRLLSGIFYRLFRLLVNPDMPRGGFDFFLLDRRAADVLVQSSEKNASLAASVLWVGFRRAILPYHRGARRHGTSRWTFWKRFKYMYDSLLSYSYVPLRLMSALGVVGMLFSAGYAAWIVVHRLLGAYEPLGWASLMVVMLFLNGFMLVAIGTVGEYVWRTLDAARKRPEYIVADCHDPQPPATANESTSRD